MSVPTVTPDPLADLLRPCQRPALDSVDLVLSVHRALLPGRYTFTTDEQLVGLAGDPGAHLAAGGRAGPGRASHRPGDDGPAGWRTDRNDRRLIELLAADWDAPAIAAQRGCTAAVVRAGLAGCDGG